MMLMKLVDPVDNKHFKKYQKICFCNAETTLFIGMSLIQDLYILYALKNTSNTTSVSNYMYSSLKMLYNSHSNIFTQTCLFFLKTTNNKAKTQL